MRNRPISMVVFALCCVTTICPDRIASGQSYGPTPVEIKITARRFQFEPRTITVLKGKPVRLLITSTDTDHGFAIKELGINQRINANATTVIEFTPTRSGQFEFSCSVFCGEGHKEMTGELVVTDDQATQASRIRVEFDERNAGVVIVESNGERLRIDTRNKKVTPVEEVASTDSPEQKTSPVVVEEKKAPSSEPYDYRLVNVPTPKRVLRGSLNLYFTHRFSQPIRPLRESGRTLLGLDSFSASSLGLFYGVTDKLYVSAYRSPICQPGLCRTIELGVGYHWLDEGGRSPLALSTYASIEGDENFSQNYTYNLQVMMARSITKRVTVFFAPALHLNANGQRRFDPRPEDVFPPSPLANQFRQPRDTGSFGFGLNARVRPTISVMVEYTPRVGFKLGQVVPTFSTSTGQVTGFQNESDAEIGFGVEKDIGRHTFSLTFSNTQTTTTSRYNSSNLVLPASRFIIGFNLYRRFLR
jgi:cytochrome c oxidase subunit II